MSTRSTIAWAFSRSVYRLTNEQVRLLSTLGFLVGAEIERARLETEKTQLSSRFEARKAVDRAKSVLQRDLSLNENDAYQMMQKESRQRRKSMREIAEAILLAEDFRRAGLLPSGHKKKDVSRY
jgi:uroporphyrinogen-III synthase